MKKITIFLILLVTITNIFAESTTGNLNLAAYKIEAAPTPTDGILTVYVKTTDGIPIENNRVIDISDDIALSRTVNRAFSIEIITNLKASTTVKLEFSPFINQSDNTKKIGITYGFSNDPYITVAGSESVEGGHAKCRYTPEAHLTGNVTSINVPANTTTPVSIDLTQSVAKIEKRNNQWVAGWNSPEWETVSDYLWNGKNTLPSFVGTEVISTTSNFSLSISESDYNEMPTNTDYFAEVKLTVTYS